MSDGEERFTVELSRTDYDRLQTLLGDGHVHVLKVEHVKHLSDRWDSRMAWRRFTKFLEDQAKWIAAMGVLYAIFQNSVNAFLEGVLGGMGP